MLVALVGSTGVRAEEPAFYFGAAVHVGHGNGGYQGASEPAKVKDLLNGAGLNSFRDEFWWGNDLEYRKGVFRHPRNSRDGSLHRLIENKGSYSPLIILDGLNNKHYGGGLIPLTPEAIEGFARYAEYIASLYRNSVPLFEIWNEWDGALSGHGSAEDYARLVKAVAPRVRRAAPNAKILASTAGIEFSWSKAFAAAGGLDEVDGFAIHPYFGPCDFNSSPHRSVEWLLDDRQKEMYDATSPQYRNSHTEIPFYITEVGFTTATNCATEAEAANWAVKFALLARTRPYIKGIWWYELVDEGDTLTNYEHNFGLYKSFSKGRAAKLIVNELKKISNSIVYGKQFKINGKQFEFKDISEHKPPVYKELIGDTYTVEWIDPDGAPRKACWKRETTIANGAPRGNAIGKVTFDAPC
jgi:hypothetical protein